MATTNIINAVFGSGICTVTTSAFRANYGMKLRFSGIDLPTAFEVDFSNYDVSGKDSLTAIGQNNEVQIPDDLWDSGLNIYAYVYLHPTDDSGVTVYTVTIPVLGRPNRTEEQPTPHEQSVIEQAISALNDAVEQTAADVVAADASASAAAQSEANAATSERSAAASAGAALASQNAAESASQSATESATNASESARNAAVSAEQAAQSATNAQESAEQAEQSAQSISGDVERAERAAATATEKATEAGQSATAAAASASAALASQNAAHASETASAQSASSASVSEQNAASSAQSAESSATDAEQAKTDAQDAQAAAEQAAQSISGLSAQIVQNTADIADLVQSKAGVLVDTATGSITSFYPDATVPTVKGLTVDVEPVQDLHGYDAPWPAGGGVNKINLGSPCTFTTIKDQPIVTISQGTAWVYRDSFSYTTTPASGSKNPYVVFYDENDNVVGGIWVNPSAKTSSVSLAGDAVKVRIYSNGYNYGDSNGVEVTITGLVISTTEVSAYAPYSNICPISGWDEVEVQRTGKNLLDDSNCTSNRWNIFGIPNTLKPNTAYTISFHGSIVASFSLWLNSSQTAVSTTTQLTPYIGTGSHFTFTTPSDMEEKWLLIGANAAQSENILINDVLPQIELGSTATAYTPYQGDTYQIQLGQTVYGGTVDAVQGVLTVDRAMVDLGTLPWDYISPTSNIPYGAFYANVFGKSKKENDVVCSSYPLSTNYFRADKSVLGNSASNTVYVIDSFYTDTATFKTAMSGVQLVYELATPITVNLTPIEISVLTGQTNNVWADCGNVSVEYAADLKTYIDQKIAAAVAALS